MQQVKLKRTALGDLSVTILEGTFGVHGLYVEIEPGPFRYGPEHV